MTDSIRFPAPTEQMAGDRQLKAEASSRTLRILVADDGLFARELVTEFLTRDGHTVQTAASVLSQKFIE